MLYKNTPNFTPKNNQNNPNFRHKFTKNIPNFSPKINKNNPNFRHVPPKNYISP